MLDVRIATALEERGRKIEKLKEEASGWVVVKSVCSNVKIQAVQLRVIHHYVCYSSVKGLLKIFKDKFFILTSMLLSHQKSPGHTAFYRSKNCRIFRHIRLNFTSNIHCQHKI